MQSLGIDFVFQNFTQLSEPMDDVVKVFTWIKTKASVTSAAWTHVKHYTISVVHLAYYKCFHFDTNGFQKSYPSFRSMERNMNEVSGDSFPYDESPRASIQTKGSCVQGQNYKDCAEESSKLQSTHMHSDKVTQRFSERTYEGSVEICNDETKTFQGMHQNGISDEVEEDDDFVYIDFLSNKVTAEDASPGAASQPSVELPCGYPTKDIATEDATKEGNGRKRPRVPSVQNVEGSGQPSQASESSSKSLRRCENVNPIVPIEPPTGLGIEDGCQTRVLSVQVQPLCSKRGKRKNAIQGAPVKQSSPVGTEGSRRYRALRMRAENAGDIGRPRVQSSGSKRQKHEKITRGAPSVQQSADVGKEGRGGYKALRIRAENAVKVSKPRKAGKPRGTSSSSKGQKSENIPQGTQVHHSSDVGTEKSRGYKALRIRAQNA